jgi:sugar phosphate isomerase/epimerase
MTQGEARIRSAVTVSLVPEARGGPFVFWDDLPAAARRAAQLGFDAIEIFPPDAHFMDPRHLGSLLESINLKLAAVGTGAGRVKHKLHLCLSDAAGRRRARDFIGSIIDFAGQLGAPTIIGSMQGGHGELSHEEATKQLLDALNGLGEHARQRHGVPLLYEPLNRYETNHCNTIEQGLALLDRLTTKNVKLLADLFHMNIEEADVPAALKLGGDRIGHVHFVDSNRRPAGCGHTDFAPIAAALRDIRFTGYASAEAFPWPNPEQAAELTINAFRRLFAKI